MTTVPNATAEKRLVKAVESCLKPGSTARAERCTRRWMNSWRKSCGPVRTTSTKANGGNRVLAPAASGDWLHVRRVWTLPRGLVIDGELAGRTFDTEDKTKAALRERLPKEAA